MSDLQQEWTDKIAAWHMIKILSWEGDGFVIWYKRLEKGTFPACGQGHGALTRQQFVLLLEGVVPNRPCAV